MLVETNQLSFSYEEGKPFQLPEVRLREREQLLILGQSGSGKTTLLHIIGGLLAPKAGTVHIAGQSLYSLKGAALDKFRGQHIGIIFQKPHILAPLTVMENLQMANFFGKRAGNRNETLLKDLDIWHKRDQKVTTLSEGEAQRVSIARALANSPQLILADEPTASLDDANAARVIALLQEQAEKQQAALIVVTHDQRVKQHISTQLEVGGVR
ncbi:MAG: ABC transporter ATP-binding protein [Nitritalea sp.]